jgi:cell filamentation protein, protein adenylyltransferase
MERSLQGHYSISMGGGEQVKAFIPDPLPPQPPIEWSFNIREKFDQALMALGKLDSISILLPDTSLFLYTYVRKEAVLSSQIEGTQSSLSDLLLYELEQQPGVPLDDVQEVSNYVAALKHGLKRLSEGFPLSLRLIREIHGVLLSNGRGNAKAPGEFRKSQNWIGGNRPGNAMFVPPPPDQVMNCIGQLELFLHNQPEPTPALLKAALAHVQFETIHPFLDGNGRIGRLLITLLLCEQKVLREPMLYLSLYFKTHREQYYELLNIVRFKGNWEAWLEFFAEAVIETANQAVGTVQRLIKLEGDDRAQISQSGRIASSVLRVHRALCERPLTTVNALTGQTNLSIATINKCLVHLLNLGVVHELTERKRGRVFAYSAYLDIMNRGLEK